MPEDDLPKIRAACSLSTLVICALPRIYRGAVAPRVTAALLGRFLPRLGPLAYAGGPFLSRRRLIGAPRMGGEATAK